MEDYVSYAANQVEFWRERYSQDKSEIVSRAYVASSMQLAMMIGENIEIENGAELKRFADEFNNVSSIEELSLILHDEVMQGHIQDNPNLAQTHTESHFVRCRAFEKGIDSSEYMNLVNIKVRLDTVVEGEQRIEDANSRDEVRVGYLEIMTSIASVHEIIGELKQNSHLASRLMSRISAVLSVAQRKKKEPALLLNRVSKLARLCSEVDEAVVREKRSILGI